MVSKKEQKVKAYYDNIIGECLSINANGIKVIKSKYKSAETALESHKLLIGIGVGNSLYAPYKCKHCSTWHMGNEIQIKVERQ